MTFLIITRNRANRVKIRIQRNIIRLVRYEKDFVSGSSERNLEITSAVYALVSLMDGWIHPLVSLQLVLTILFRLFLTFPDFSWLFLTFPDFSWPFLIREWVRASWHFLTMVVWVTKTIDMAKQIASQNPLIFRSQNLPHSTKNLLLFFSTTKLMKIFLKQQMKN